MLISGVTSEMSKLKEKKFPPVDRLRTCPLLLRVFCSLEQHHSIESYTGGNSPENELQIYTWLDASLAELSQLIKDVHPQARRHGTKFEFSIVKPSEDLYKQFKSEQCGQTQVGKRGEDDHKRLATLPFQIGDYFDVAIVERKQNRRNGSYCGGRGQQYSRDGEQDRRAGRDNYKQSHRHEDDRFVRPRDHGLWNNNAECGSVHFDKREREESSSKDFRGTRQHRDSGYFNHRNIDINRSSFSSPPTRRGDNHRKKDPMDQVDDNSHFRFNDKFVKSGFSTPPREI
ncbi:unnamed protein product [Didymodactylos carnosus]|uniref:18 kDa Sin3-associated polypeptide n=1 Tax=Didymodactylos carnosus TaxID=1234261 RepID=A0A814HXM1_9BILA|nr:unnamed protein product [Didymodactylos carnosus]CAF3786862.1 unnamed protein product [Didymodactylos carnosus]